MDKSLTLGKAVQVPKIGYTTFHKIGHTVGHKQPLPIYWYKWYTVDFFSWEHFTEKPWKTGKLQTAIMQSVTYTFVLQQVAQHKLRSKMDGVDVMLRVLMLMFMCPKLQEIIWLYGSYVVEGTPFC